jgi:hypothetical protein
MQCIRRQLPAQNVRKTSRSTSPELGTYASLRTTPFPVAQGVKAGSLLGTQG